MMVISVEMPQELEKEVCLNVECGSHIEGGIDCISLNFGSNVCVNS